MLILRALRFELLLQLRSLRFRFGVLACLFLPIATPYGFYLLQPNFPQAFGAGTYLANMLNCLRFPTVVLAIIIAGNRADLEGLRQMWSVLGSAKIGNAGYLFRRCLAQGILLTGLTLIPFATTLGALALAGVPLEDPWRPVGSWLLFILPVGFLFIFLWSALTHITGTELGSILILLFGKDAAGYVLAKVVQPILGTRLIIHMDWLGMENFQHTVYRLIRAVENPEWVHGHRGYLASDTPFSIEIAGQRWMASASLYMGICALILPCATFFLRRSRKDLAPLKLSEGHQLRNLIGQVHKLRQRYAIDAALVWERYWLLAGLLCLLGAAAFIDQRQAKFSGLADRQYRALTEVDQYPATPEGVRFTHWSMSGELTPLAVDVRSTGLLRHEGQRAASALPFTLNPFLEVETQIQGRRVETIRRWDRLVVTMEPELRPGEEIKIDFRVHGRPYAPAYEMGRRRWSASFALRYERMMGDPAGFTGDLSQSEMNPLLSRRGFDLAAHDLAPVIRYGTWKLTPKPVLEGEPGYEVPQPAAFPLQEISVDIHVPDGWFLGDSCGNSSHPDSRMRGECQDSLSRYRAFGGLHRVVRADDQIVIAALPGHETLLDNQYEPVQSVIALSGEAWPGVPAIDRLVVIEEAPRPDPLRPTRSFYYRARRFRAEGRLLRVAEQVAIEQNLLPVEQIVGAVMAGDLLQRRDFDPNQSWVFNKMFGALMARRMGVAGNQSAALAGEVFDERVALFPLLTLEHYIPFVFEKKVPALWAYLESLVGAENLYAGVEEFLSSSSEEPGTVEELIETLERHSGESLQTFYQDFLDGKSLPKLSLHNVSQVTTPKGWRVTGTLRNTGTGEVRCPVHAKAENQEQKTLVTVGDKSEADFQFDFDFPPHTVQLDPADTCYRWITKGRLKVERVSLIGGR